MDIAGLVIEKKDKKWQVRIWGPLRPHRRTSARKINVVVVALAIAVLGLVVLLALQLAPALGTALLRLLGVL